MQLREFLNNNSALVTILAVVLLIVALGAIVMQINGGGGYTPRVVDVYYYDLDTGELFLEKSNEIPPVETASGPHNGVRAYVFACNDCDEESDRFIGWLEMYTPEAKAALTRDPAEAQPDEAPFDYWEEGHLVRSIDSDEWQLANSEPGFRIMENIRDKCPGGTPKPCFPGR